MKIHTLLVVSLTLIFPACITSQQATATGEVRKLFSIEGYFKTFDVDNLQNIYVVTPANEVIKYTPDGMEQYRYPNSTLGNIRMVDASNPFLLLLFFPEYQNVLLLDRTLSPAGQFNLFRTGLLEVPAVGMASDNRLWAYDATTFQLKKIEQDGKVLFESTDLSLELNRSVKPERIVERNQQVFLLDPEVGILLFDVFGRYLKTLELKGLKDFQVNNDELLYLEKGTLKAFGLRALTERKLRLPEGLQQPAMVRLLAGRFYALDSKGIQVFSL